mmetsp:Transcript_23157/g.41852  ORF Transcript_23157/g.41852 Transcript_23157/m.41852 type:complete len:368 (+) Transcript_23157:107-1210(+)|eukprot:CAMPEP_0197664032 /NCGR_PEP_ID=MMETSP1338-20131121/58387_1 /TAXON_ID=43686 ORGANISM="Pelagodinium beii, Strain RCC1491" /NCGR_SAMPLE_ID=MMETSP1338 /ASSEMBLY_ACC=CAM_ASM_000754 /LENGTH=367 /DNA_ID=CAMNT_0043242585 /DNA_START=107 /DNA_END=1210 /DNA_ORIENTATION=-
MGKKSKAKAAGAPAPVVGASSVNLSADLAALVQQKIQEFEKNSAEDSEKHQQAQKGKARAVAKNKLKEAKQICSNAELEDGEKLKQLLQRLEAEDTEAESLVEEEQDRREEISSLETEADSSQAELSRALSTKTKLESLYRQLQQQTNNLVEERRRLTDAERQRRQDLADEFQQTIADVKTKMDNQASERSRLALENEVLRNKFKDFFEKYDAREKELVEQQKTREVEVKAFELKLNEHAQSYRVEAERERRAKMENEQLTSAEQALKTQLKTYSEKFHHFQDQLGKSDKVLGQYKRQKGKMQRRAETLDKENRELNVRNEKKIQQLQKEKETLLKEKEQMQEKCKALQTDRQRLNEETQALNGNGK